RGRGPPAALRPADPPAQVACIGDHTARVRQGCRIPWGARPPLGSGSAGVGSWDGTQRMPTGRIGRSAERWNAPWRRARPGGAGRASLIESGSDDVRRLNPLLGLLDLEL